MSTKLDDNKIALRYARALFETAVEQGEAATVRQDLTQIGELFETVPDLTGFLANPGVPQAEKQDLLTQQFKGVQPLVARLLKILVENNRASVVSALVRHYNDLSDRHENVAQAEIITAVPLDGKLEGKLKKALESRFGYSRVEVETRVDPGILGGVIVKIKDQVIDGSFVGRLEELRKHVG